MVETWSIDQMVKTWSVGTNHQGSSPRGTPGSAYVRYRSSAGSDCSRGSNIPSNKTRNKQKSRSTRGDGDVVVRNEPANCASEQSASDTGLQSAGTRTHLHVACFITLYVRCVALSASSVCCPAVLRGKSGCRQHKTLTQNTHTHTKHAHTHTHTDDA